MIRASAWLCASALAFAMAAGAGEPAVPAEAKPEQAPPAAAAAAQPDAEKIAQATEAEDPVVCKSVEATGSRIRKGRVCKPRSVWENHERQAETFMKSVERGNSTGVGGQSVPTDP